MEYFIRPAVLLIGTVLSACAPSPAVESAAVAELVAMAPDVDEGQAGLVFAVQPKVAAPGSAVTLVLSNKSAFPIGHNLCSSTLEQRSGTGWRAVAGDGVCTLELRIAQPGQTAQYQRRLPANVGEGDFRFRTGVESPKQDTGGLETIVSQPFLVRR